ncbi:MAG: branched-chain amino acid ABC transporter permease [Rhodobacteraceae bacterium]|jgi:branched-chain amino acid transport system permease protein|nr:branched-chain amino acid ABC transporter permease [Paracoccaceae bacterium]
MFHLELLTVGLIQGAMYAMMALGLTLIYGLLRILHIAHAALFTLGAYAGVLAANAGLGLLPAAIVAVAIGGIAGPLVYVAIYRPLLDKPPYVALIASIGLLIALEDGFRLVFGPYGLSFDNNPWFITGWMIGGIYLNAVQAAIAVTAILSIAAFTWFARRTRAGVAWRATVTDPAMARTFGVEPDRVRIMSFAIASMLAAVAGVLIGLLNNLVEPTMGSIIAYKGLAIIVLGGLGNVPGTLVAALLLGVAESFGQTYLDQVLDRDAIAFLVLIVVLMVRPQGLFGKAG